MIDDDKKGKWLVPLESQSGGCSLGEALQQRHKRVEDALYSFSWYN